MDYRQFLLEQNADQTKPSRITVRLTSLEFLQLHILKQDLGLTTNEVVELAIRIAFGTHKAQQAGEAEVELAAAV